MNIFKTRAGRGGLFFSLGLLGFMTLPALPPEPLDTLKTRLGFQSPGLLMAKIRTSLREGRYQETLPHLSRALSKHPKDASALHYGLGVTYGALGRHGEKIEELRQALRLDETQSAARFKLALAIAALGQHQEAIHHYRKTIQFQEDHPAAAYFLGLSYYLMHRYQEAILPLKKHSRRHPDAPEAYYALGLTYLKLERYKEGIKYMEEALKRDPAYLARLQHGAQNESGINSDRKDGITPQPRGKGTTGHAMVQETRFEQK